MNMNKYICVQTNTRARARAYKHCLYFSMCIGFLIVFLKNNTSLYYAVILLNKNIDFCNLKYGNKIDHN